MKTEGNNRLSLVYKYLRTMTLMILMIGVANLGGRFSVFAASAKKANFTGEQVFRGMNFGDGPVAELFPEVWKSPQTAQLVGDGEQGKAFKKLREKVVSGIKENDPTFMDRYGREMKSGEQLRIQTILEESSQKIDAVIKNIVTNGDIQNSQISQANREIGLFIVCYVVLICQIALTLYPGLVVLDNFVITIPGYPLPGMENSSSKLSRESYVNAIAEKLDETD